MNIKANKIGVNESFLRDWLFVKKKTLADLTRETRFTGGGFLCKKYGIKVPSSKDVMQRPEFRRKRSEISLRDWQNSFYREKHIKGMKGAPNTRKGKPRLEQRKFKHSKEEMEKLIKEGKTYKEICDIVGIKCIYYYLNKWGLKIPYKAIGEKNHNFGKHLSEETKEKQRISIGKNYINGYINPRKNCILTEETINKMKKTKEKLYASGYISPIKGRLNPVTRERNLKNNPAKIEGVRQKISNSHKKLCRENPQHLKELMMKARKGCILPNKSELKLNSLIQKIAPNEFKYVGNGQVIIEGKCPDFINCNGKKQIIELFGEYWHPETDEEKRVNLFKGYGYDTLVVWCKELKNEEAVCNKIKDFCFEPVRVVLN